MKENIRPKSGWHVLGFLWRIVKEAGWIMAVFSLAITSLIFYKLGIQAKGIIFFTPEAEAQEYQSTMICQNLLLNVDEVFGLRIFSLGNPLDNSPPDPSLIGVYPLAGSGYILAGMCAEVGTSTSVGTGYYSTAGEEGPRVYIAYEDRERARWSLVAIDLTLPSDPFRVVSIQTPLEKIVTGGRDNE